LIKIDYAQYTNEELEDVWQQVDDNQYPTRAIDIYLVMYKRKIERFDNQPEFSSIEKELMAYLEEEYQYQQRELSAKENRIVKLIENRCQ